MEETTAPPAEPQTSCETCESLLFGLASLQVIVVLLVVVIIVAAIIYLVKKRSRAKSLLICCERLMGISKGSQTIGEQLWKFVPVPDPSTKLRRPRRGPLLPTPEEEEFPMVDMDDIDPARENLRAQRGFWGKEDIYCYPRVAPDTVYWTSVSLLRNLEN